MRLGRLGMGLAVVLLAGSAPADATTGSAAGGYTVRASGFGANPGNLGMVSYVSDGLPSGRPLVVALHGCDTSPSRAREYARHSGWRELADRQDFALLLPRQRLGNNASGCFNWFRPWDTLRGWGEAASIRSMVDAMLVQYGSDPGRVYVTGLSAGGAMTAVMLATYPDVFSAGGIVAGVPYDCADSMAQALACMSGNRDLTPRQWGTAVREVTYYGGPWPEVSLWHGTADTVVDPVNMRELMEQWTNVHGTDQRPDSSGTIAGYPHRVYRAGSGDAVVETVELTGMAHGQPVNPGSKNSQCGQSGRYYPDAGVCAAYHINEFFTRN